MEEWSTTVVPTFVFILSGSLERLRVCFSVSDVVHDCACFLDRVCPNASELERITRVLSCK